MPTYDVHVIIENKPGISDPEGATILNDLVLKEKKTLVSKITTAQMLKFTVEDQNKEMAKKTIEKICNDLRIYNPLVSQITLDVFDSSV